MEAQRGEPSGYRLTRHCEALEGCLLPGAPTGLSLMVVLDRCTPWGQLWTPPVTLPHRRHGRRVQRMAVWCPCRRPSMCRPGHGQGMRHALLDLATVVPATPCHQRNDVETYRRSRNRDALHSISVP